MAKMRKNNTTDNGTGEPSKDESANQMAKLMKNDTTNNGTHEPPKEDSANQMAGLMKGCNTAIEEGFRKMKDKLKAELKMELKKSFGATNAGVDELRSWFQWIMGKFGLAVAMKAIFYDTWAEGKVLDKIDETEKRLTKMVEDSEKKVTKMMENSITQLKHELKISQAEWCWTQKENGKK
ncbi:hypothetical protein HOY82DRAFT_640207 [Tuber indicum]|nr:hypothetical protein HOY82DRAFT_640207 [Tuber indicum]